MKVSIITTCMNRFNHLKQTLPKNLFYATDYPDVEFIIIDYSSSDNSIENWIKSTFLMECIESGRLVYYKFNGAKQFSHSHSKNLGIRLASGELVINVDADNFIGKGFLPYVVNEIHAGSDFMLACHIIDMETVNWVDNKKDVVGRIAIKKDILFKIGGYNETFDGYGFEDMDLFYRLIGLEYKHTVFNSKFLLKPIAHTNEARIFNCIEHNMIKSNYLNRQKSMLNLIRNIYTANPYGFGKGIVYKNFSTDPLIIE